MTVLVESPHGAARFEAALQWLCSQPASTPVLLLAPTLDAAADLMRAAARVKHAVFGWSRESLGSLALRLATHPLATQRLTPASPLVLEAICARVVSELQRVTKLGKLSHVADRPGLPRALLRTFTELGMSAVESERLEPELALAFEQYKNTLAEAALADRSQVFAAAIEAVRASSETFLGVATCFYDLPIKSRLERELARAVGRRAPDFCATVPASDSRCREVFAACATSRWTNGEDTRQAAAVSSPSTAVKRLQAQLFAAPQATGELGEEIAILSAPGESREAVEIVRRVLAEAERGVPLDRMAILLRSPGQYRLHLVEALRRAGVPAHFSKEAARPEAQGRALLVLLECAAERFTASRFGEYLSLGVVPTLAADGGPPLARAADVRFALPECDSIVSGAAGALGEKPAPRSTAAADAMQSGGHLAAPRRWEALLVDAAVIGGEARWRRRLLGLEHDLERKKKALIGDDARVAALDRDLSTLRELAAFALPIIDLLAALPRSATWGVWLDALTELATRAIADPVVVLAALSELELMRPVGPVGLDEVRAVLSRRLGDTSPRSSPSRGGEIIVASIDEARGRVFDVVFIPGLAEKMFPQKVAEDPLLRDEQRRVISPELEVQEQRVAGERLALALAVGAARQRVVFSYPRFESEKSRPRVPSFYALEALRAAEGRLPGFVELARRAGEASQTRMGWPAPNNSADAIDVTEYDLSLLYQLLHGEEQASDGAAHYLLKSNDRLRRSLQFRGRRWRPEWRNVDGLVQLEAPGRAAFRARDAELLQRGFAVTSLERYAACPYQFYLSTIVGLRPRESPAALEELDPATRGSLIHEILNLAGSELRKQNLLSAPEHAPRAQALLDEIIDMVAEKWRDDLAPAIDRVWHDGIEDIRADLRQWLRLCAESEWQPVQFELAFGLNDPGSCVPDQEPVTLSFGAPLRGAIDLVEQSGSLLRATDYKTGQCKNLHTVLGGGTYLQPAFYALVLEKLFPEQVTQGGTAFYCTSKGGFKRGHVALTDRVRESAAAVYATIRAGFETEFFPAAPAREACDKCNYRGICGPYEPQRVAQKDPSRLESLARLRQLP